MSTSSSSTKRAWKLQEFVAHGANVNCLALGHKSGRVLVTGGDDKKVNLWAVGKPNCIMSLCGHTTPVECVRFGHTEELVCAGSQSGALKIWDLEAARLVRTLTGHKSGIKCIDFHPYGDFVSSGSTDTNLKLWDIRRKGCIFTYKGHSQTINSLKFSPDGQWIASAGEEGAVKIWDLRAGKLMNEFYDHGSAVHDVEFHPHEFLLASASSDRTVNFWDLETFQLISTTERDTGPVKTITFHPEGDCVFSGSNDSLKVHGWEPAKVCDNLLMGWGKVKDIAIASTQLIGAAHQMSNVSLYVVDLKRVKPFGSYRQPQQQSLPSLNQSFRTGASARRSFIKEKADLRVQVSEEQTESGTDAEDSDHYSQADINDYQNYENIFRPRQRELNRTPPPPDEPFQAPVSESESILSRPHELRVKAKNSPSSPSPTRRSSQPSLPPQNVRPRRGSNTPVRPASVYDSPVFHDPNARTAVQTQIPGSPHSRNYRSTSVQPRSSTDPRTNAEEDIGRCSSLNRSGPFTPLTSVSRIQINSDDDSCRPLDRPTLVKPSRTSSDPPAFESLKQPFDFYSAPPSRLIPYDSLKKLSVNDSTPEKEEVIPMNSDKPSGIELDDFLPNKFASSSISEPSLLSHPPPPSSSPSKFGNNVYDRYQQSELSESEVTSSILKGHESMMSVLTARGRNLEIIQRMWQSKDAKTAVDQAVSLRDQTVIVDLLSVITLRPSIWNLDLCTALLPSIGELLQSKYEMYINIGCGAMKLILKNFASVIKSNIDSPVQTLGVDISREERHNKCMQCYKDLVKIRSLILKRQTMQGKLGHTYRELSILMQYLD